MQRRPMGGSGLAVAASGSGGWELGDTSGSVDEREMAALLDAAARRWAPFPPERRRGWPGGAHGGVARGCHAAGVTVIPQRALVASARGRPGQGAGELPESEGEDRDGTDA